MMDTRTIVVCVSKAPIWTAWIGMVIHWVGILSVLWFNYAYLGNGWVLNLAAATLIILMFFGLQIWARSEIKRFKTKKEAADWLATTTDDEDAKS